MIALYRYTKKKRAQRSPQSTQQAQQNDAADTRYQGSVQQADGDKGEETLPAPSAEDHVSRRYIWKIMLCLWLPFFLSTLDLTVVATALPFIASHFDRFNQLNWAVTAFTLTATAFIPLFGQLADTFGRHSSLQLAIWAITIGSIICAAAPTWSVLLLGRALQGMGTAGVQNVVMIILADKVSLQQQAKNTSIFQLLAGTGYSIGPVVGGYLTNRSWRYCFVLPTGIGGLSIVSVYLMRKDLLPGSVSLNTQEHSKSRLQHLVAGLRIIDFGGAALFMTSVVLIILGTAWGGSTYPWASAVVIVPIVVGFILFAAFALYEYLLEPGRWLSSLSPATIPMISIHVLRNKEVSIISILGAGSDAAMYSVFYFIGIYFVLVEAKPAGEAGTQLLYYIPGLGNGVLLAIFLVNKWPRQTFPPLLLGTITEMAGIAALTCAVKVQNSTLVNAMMVVAGMGTGLRYMPSNLHLAGMLRDHLASAYSMHRFSHPFGGTLALTIMGAVFQNKMAKYFGSLNGDAEFNLHNTAALDAISNLPANDQTTIRSAGADATMWAFISILPFLGLSMLVSFGLGNVWIAKSKSESEVNEVGGQTEAQTPGNMNVNGEVDRGIYLLNTLRRGWRTEKPTATTPYNETKQ